MGFSYFPHWLEALLGEKFFNPCLIHETVKKNEKNIFCLDCSTSICSHCLSPHRSHRLLQIRRYVYHDVIRLDDMEKLIDCSFVQSYSTNNAKVVFLNQRPQSRPFRGSGNICTTCDRSLQDPYIFCSLACKVHYLVKKEGGLSKYLYECEFLPLRESGCYEFENGQMTPDSILDSPDSFGTSSGSGSSASGGVGCRTLVCTATTEFVKKKRSSVSGSRTAFRGTCSSATESSAPHMNRRKGTPNRSPLY
ncbi:protein RGF1 INDUCIBLE TRANSCRIPTION FACTOR 1-like [Magnolia sinica]|uniref:protein RGF1 INDUCIBLE TRANSCRIPTION FACTOR 1-like n=1 Tax=Magnolia sinica TaxID=86752 RepID=UPI002657FD5D|nr:protein RGF1 INDUCIBLE TRANSCRIPTION FACTOR 1-like [Magnolia sinica]